MVWIPPPWAPGAQNWLCKQSFLWWRWITVGGYQALSLFNYKGPLRKQFKAVVGVIQDQMQAGDHANRKHSASLPFLQSIAVEYPLSVTLEGSIFLQPRTAVRTENQRFPAALEHTSSYFTTAVSVKSALEVWGNFHPGGGDGEAVTS